MSGACLIFSGDPDLQAIGFWKEAAPELTAKRKNSLSLAFVDPLRNWQRSCFRVRESDRKPVKTATLKEYNLGIKKLISKCQKQDIKAQEQLYKLYAHKLFPVCLKYSSNYQQAEDNLQDAFMMIFNKISQYNHTGSFEGWMKRIAINTALQKYRKQAVFEIVREDHLKEAEIEIDEDAVSVDFLLEIIQQLPERYRQVFNLYALDGFSHREISELLDISTGTSKSNLARARNILKEKLEEAQIKSTARSV